MLNYFSDKQLFLKSSYNLCNFSEFLYKSIYNSPLNSFISINDFRSETDDCIESDLYGLHIAVKDNISTKGFRTTAGSKMLENYLPVYNATIIDKLKNSGAVICGKTNLDEFGVGSTGQLSFYGPVKNAIDESFISGGSSSGSAVAVASGLSHAAIGSDTGGSVRLPAAFNRVFGFKPTYGAISRYGLIAHASSLDTIGIIAPEPKIIELIFRKITGKDVNDKTSINTNRKTKYNFSNMKLAIAGNTILDNCTNEIQNAFKKMVYSIDKNGLFAESMDFKTKELWMPVYLIISSAELSSNMRRYDGVRYGFSYESEKTEDYYNARKIAFGEELKRRILMGTYVLLEGYADKYYLKAKRAVDTICKEFNNILRNYDFLLMPTSARSSGTIKEKSSMIDEYYNDELNVAVNLCGLPSINIPYNNKSILSGFQVIGKKGDDYKIVQFADFLKNYL